MRARQSPSARGVVALPSATRTRAVIGLVYCRWSCRYCFTQNCVITWFREAELRRSKVEALIRCMAGRQQPVA